MPPGATGRHAFLYLNVLKSGFARPTAVVDGTSDMMASSGTVSRAIESTAGVAEENSAASEEVSASVEEMSAHVEEVLAAAQSLTDTADELERSMAAFKTDEGAATDASAMGRVRRPR